MNITTDKKDYLVVKNSYSFVIDDEGTIFPFEVVVTEEEEEDTDIEISWDDDQPKNLKKVEDEIKSIF